MNCITPFLRYIANTSCLPNHHFTRAYDCRFLYILEGSGALVTSSEDIPLKQDTFVYYPAGISYYPRSFSQNPMEFITANFDFTCRYAEKTALLPPVCESEFIPSKVQRTYDALETRLFDLPFRIENAFPLKNDLLRLTSLFRGDSCYLRESCSSLLALVLYEVQEMKRRTLVENPLVNQVREFITQHYGQPLDNKTIASALKYHPYYLNSLFKAHTGMTIHKYVLDYRLNQSNMLILHTNQPISQVAEACGFPNADHFSKCFKNHYGISPSDYRKKYHNI